MNIVHILEDFSFLSGGLRTVVKDLHNRLIYDGVNSTIITTRKENDDEVIRVDGGNRPWRFSKNLSSKLNDLHAHKKIDIIHIHGVWMYPQYAAAKFSVKNKIPFIISCHGMYEPWLWLNSNFKKKVYFKYVVKNIFSKAKYLHAITLPEANELKKLFPNTNIVEIPNLIDSSSIKIDAPGFKEKYVLYLGRIDKKKGIDILINAFANVDNKNLKLKIAGGYNDYQKELEALVKSLNLNDKVEFVGLVTGAEKEILFKNAFVFVAPSHSEVVGMVNLESAALGTPVITTKQTGLKKEWSDNGGFLVNPNVDEVQKALEVSLNWSSEERNENGKKLNNFVTKEYSWEYRFKDWLNLYKSIL
jgi:glycosyltransferase involved in cell wall biosynthesis